MAQMHPGRVRRGGHDRPSGRAKNTRVEERARAVARRDSRALGAVRRVASRPVGGAGAGRSARLRAAAETDVVVSPVPVDTLIPSRIPEHDDAPLHRRRFTSEVAPAVVAVSICAFVILLSESFDSVIAVGVGALLMLGGVVALVRRVPLARAYTFGLVAAAVLIRFS